MRRAFALAGVILGSSLALRGAAAAPSPSRTGLPPAGPAARRARLAADLAGGVAVVFAARPPEETRYLENPDFFYLVGEEAPNARLLVRNAGAPSRTISTLYLPLRDRRSEGWIGERPGASADEEPNDVEARRLGVDRVAPLDTFDHDVARALGTSGRLWLPLVPTEADAPPTAEQLWIERLRRSSPAVEIRDLSPALATLRSRKEAGEIEAIRRAVAATIRGHRAAARAVCAGADEATVDGAVYAAYRAAGASGEAFPSVVASGPRSTILHYEKNSSPIPSGGLVLLDLGARVDGYCADLTRTLPASGRFTPRQRELYGALVEARAAAIAKARPGARLVEIHEAARRTLAAAGLESAMRHFTTHHLGIDVHDPGDPSEPLEAGMVLAIEPGIYFPEEGLGMRIEDDVLVTAAGPVVLSAALPVEPDDVEAWIGSEN